MFRFAGVPLNTHTFSRSINNQPQEASHTYCNMLSLFRRTRPTAPSGPGRGDMTSNALSPFEKRIQSQRPGTYGQVLSPSLVIRVL